MAEIDHTKIQDNMRSSLEYWESKKEKEKIKPKETEEILDLKYKKGEEVVDEVTGKRGEVLGGTRKIIGIKSTRSS